MVGQLVFLEKCIAFVADGAKLLNQQLRCNEHDLITLFGACSETPQKAPNVRWHGKRHITISSNEAAADKQVEFLLGKSQIIFHLRWNRFSQAIHAERLEQDGNLGSLLGDGWVAHPSFNHAQQVLCSAVVECVDQVSGVQ